MLLLARVQAEEDISRTQFTPIMMPWTFKVRFCLALLTGSTTLYHAISAAWEHFTDYWGGQQTVNNYFIQRQTLGQPVTIATAYYQWEIERRVNWVGKAFWRKGEGRGKPLKDPMSSPLGCDWCVCVLEMEVPYLGCPEGTSFHAGISRSPRGHVGRRSRYHWLQSEKENGMFYWRLRSMQIWCWLMINMFQFILQTSVKAWLLKLHRRAHNTLGLRGVPVLRPL